MAEFRYKAKNAEGKALRGRMGAADERALQMKLKEQGCFLISAKPLKASGGRRGFTSRQLADLCKELSSLLRAGVTLVRALDILSQEEGITPFAQEIYQGLLEDLKKGISLSEAMERQGYFPELMLGMVRSGEGNGNLDEVMERLSGQYEKEARLNQQVRSAMAYPMVLLVMCVAIMLLLVTFVLPKFEELFAQMDSLPVVTEIVFAVSNFLTGYWYALLVAVLLVVALTRLILGLPRARIALDCAKISLPVFGRLNRLLCTARFARTLSSLYSSGVPIGSAIGTAAETIGNRYVAGQFDEVSAKVRSGVPLSEALREVDGLMRKLSSTILIGEESGRLDTMLDSIAASLETEAEEATKRIVTMLEPIMICLMALVVAVIVIAVMLPIYQSYGAIGAE